MKRRHFLLATAMTIAVGSILAYYHFVHRHTSLASLPIEKPITPLPAEKATAESARATVETRETSIRGKNSLTEFLDQVIADAIQRGTLDPSRLSAHQLALLPEKFRPKPPSAEPQLSPEEIAHVEQTLALGENAPPDAPPQLPCPDPAHLPENYNNEYNKMILRERGCKL